MKVPADLLERGEKLISCERQISARVDQKTGLLEAEIVLAGMRTNASMICLQGLQKNQEGRYHGSFDLRSALSGAFGPRDGDPLLRIEIKRQAEFRMATE